MAKTILITGTSSGMGKLTTKFFQEKGWNVVATMINPQDDNEFEGIDNVLVTKLDVTDSDTIKEAIDAGVEKFGKIDVLVNNAGYGAFGYLESFNKSGIEKQMNVNVIGLIDVTRQMLAHFRKNRDGIIVNISSIVGKAGLPLASLYSCSKFAVEGFSEALLYEVSQIGVKVKLIEPGSFKTNFNGSSSDFRDNEGLKEYGGFASRFMEGLAGIIQNSPKPDIVAETIFEAVTDGTDRLRYLVGEDAKKIAQDRKDKEDKEFLAERKSRFGL